MKRRWRMRSRMRRSRRMKTRIIRRRKIGRMMK